MSVSTSFAIRGGLCALMLSLICVLAGCASSGARWTSQGLESQQALERARAEYPETVPADSAQEREALQRFADFFARYEPDRVERLLESTYASDVYFNDSLKTARGRQALGKYLRESAAAVAECRIEMLDRARLASGDYLLRWKMMVRYKKLNDGAETWTLGASHVRFDSEGRVVYQQDFWNATDGLYEHVPVLGGLIRAVKRRI